MANGSIYRQAGTTSIAPDLLARLAVKTTYPPIAYANTQITSGIITTPPQRPRDTGSPGPDLGYHYNPLDYIFTHCSVGSDMTFPAGTAVGWQQGPQGLPGLYFSGSGDTVEFNGTLNNPCYFVRCNTVQEADASGDGTGIAGSGLDNAYLHATFTRFSALGDSAAFVDGNWINADSINNCEFWSGLIGGTVTNLQLICGNCLFDRSFINFSGNANSVWGYLYLQNCTLHGGELTLNNYPNDYLSAYGFGSAFDGTTMEVGGTYNVNNSGSSYNAYLSVATTTLPSDQDDVTVGSFNWQSGPLGNYYLPAGSLLINADENQQASGIDVIVNGATGTQRPLSSFTTDPINQTSDANLVDIGYHYVPLLGPQLTIPCSPRESGVGVELDWSITDILQQTLDIDHFKIYRSNVSGGPYGNPIATVDASTHTYWDTSVNSGTIYYYVVTYEYQIDGTNRESPYSNQISATASLSPTLLAADATWDVTDVSDLQNPLHLGSRQAPFGEPHDYSTQHPTQPPLPAINYNWFEGNTWHTWSNHYTLPLTAGQLTQVKFSFAIDNYITVYVNNQQLAYPVPGHDYGNGGAVWSQFQQLPNLVAGNNEIGVVIGGDGGGGSYFSMVITTADCSLSGP